MDAAVVVVNERGRGGMLNEKNDGDGARGADLIDDGESNE